MSIEISTSTGEASINPKAVAAIVITPSQEMEIHMMSGTIFTTTGSRGKTKLLKSFKQGWE